MATTDKISDPVGSSTMRISGLILVFISAVVFSTAGLFTKGVSADAWSVIFWRGLFAAAFTLIYIAVKLSLIQEVLQMGKSGVAAAIFSAAGTAAFIPAFKLTSIANVSLIYASAPFAAALLAWVWTITCGNYGQSWRICWRGVNREWFNWWWQSER